MITSGQVSIGTVATAIDGVSTNPTRITIFLKMKYFG